ncbi:Thoeris anti-defense Tad2 family protein [Xenorhabdus thailandensis]|uniref:Thoeris anti-defense Tad2 family protein n=1 Tax=Xenorhabdus thailandensis TaxID=3136255 RepID=UPI0030F39F8B
MSKLNKPENMDASLKCPFNPHQYKFEGFCGEITVPIGSFAWALSQVYIGKQLLYRTGWHVPKEHIRLAHQSVANSEGDGTAYIEKSNKDGYWLPWKPTQEDLMACDWKILLLPAPYWMSFDLKIGLPRAPDYHYSGYTTEETWDVVRHFDYSRGIHEFHNIGTLSNFQNKTTIKEIVGFACGLRIGGLSKLWNLTFIVSCNEDNCQETVELLSKDLYITIDDRTYKLFHFSDGYIPIDPSDKITSNPMVIGNKVIVFYNCYADQNFDVINICSIMNQEHSKAKHFYLSWYDK